MTTLSVTQVVQQRKAGWQSKEEYELEMKRKPAACN